MSRTRKSRPGITEADDRASPPRKATVRCCFNGIEVDEMTLRVLWPMAAIHPISYDEYKATVPEKPQYTQSFSEMIAYAYHRYGLASLLVQRGGFSTHEAWILIYDHPGDRVTIERRVAAWLRGASAGDPIVIGNHWSPRSSRFALAAGA
jgi:hypothetical protein